MLLSVIICTHNPRRDYLVRTLAALAIQTFPQTEWELLLIDNCSTPSLDSAGFTLPHPHTRVVREEKLGLTPARLRGIQESRGELLVFVDDDNELARDYLETAVAMARQHPNVGVFSANIQAEYEILPPPGIHYFEPFLAIRSLDCDVIGTCPGPHVFPIGAGMLVRRTVALKHASNMAQGRADLDRKGSDLLAAGDTDFGYTAFDLGLACGSFQSLKLTHLISARRLSLTYLAKLTEDVYFSQLLLGSLRGGIVGPKPRRIKWLIGIVLMKLHPSKPWRAYKSAVLRAKLRMAKQSFALKHYLDVTSDSGKEKSDA